MARATRLQRSDVGAWLLTCNQRVWDIEGYIDSGRTSIHSWKVSTYRADMMQRGDLVFLWVTGSRHAGPTPGIRGVGRVTGPADLQVVRSDDPSDGDRFWADPENAFRMKTLVPIDLPIWPEERTIPRTAVTADSRLAELEVIRTDASMANPSFTTPAQTQALLELVGQTPAPLIGAADEVVTLGDQGAGFGDPIKNRAVEMAAMHAVIGQIEDDGWICDDVSIQKVGWDITARRHSEERHIEVKGVSGRLPSVLLTRGEHRAAQTDEKWELAVVTEVLGKKPTIRWYPAAEAVRAADPYVFRVRFDSSHGDQGPAN